MFGLGMGELVIIAIIAIVVVGPKQLPEVMKTLGKWARDLSKARDEFTESIRQDETVSNLKESLEQAKKKMIEETERVQREIDRDEGDHS